MIIKLVTASGGSAYRYVECSMFVYSAFENGAVDLDCGDSGRFKLTNNPDIAIDGEITAFLAYVIGADGSTVDTIRPIDVG